MFATALWGLLTEDQEDAIREYFDSMQVPKRVKWGYSFPILPTARVLIFGPPGTGKKYIRDRINYRVDPEDYDTTFDYEFYRQVRHIQDGTLLIDYEMLDSTTPYTAALEHYIRNSDSLFLVYAVDSKESFQALQQAYKSRIEASTRVGEVEKKCNWVLANKTDLPPETWKITTEEGEAFAHSIGAEFLSVSAESGGGLLDQDSFFMAVEILLHRLERTTHRDLQARGLNRRYPEMQARAAAEIRARKTADPYAFPICGWSSTPKPAYLRREKVEREGKKPQRRSWVRSLRMFRRGSRS